MSRKPSSTLSRILASKRSQHAEKRVDAEAQSERDNGASGNETNDTEKSLSDHRLASSSLERDGVELSKLNQEDSLCKDKRASTASSYVEIPPTIEVSPSQSEAPTTGIYRNVLSSWSASNLLSNHIRSSSLLQDSLDPPPSSNPPLRITVRHNILRKASTGCTAAARPTGKPVDASVTKRKLASSRSMALLRRQWSSRAHVSLGTKTTPRKPPYRSTASATLEDPTNPSSDEDAFRHRAGVFILPLPTPTRNRPLPPLPHSVSTGSLPTKAIRRKPVPLECEGSLEPPFTIAPIIRSRESSSGSQPQSSPIPSVKHIPSPAGSSDSLMTPQNPEDGMYARFANLDIARQFDVLFSDLNIAGGGSTDHQYSDRCSEDLSHASSTVDIKLWNSLARTAEITPPIDRHHSLQMTQGTTQSEAADQATSHLTHDIALNQVDLTRSASISSSINQTAPLVLRPHHTGNRPMGSRVKAAVARFERTELETQASAPLTPIKSVYNLLKSDRADFSAGLGNILQQPIQISSSDLTRESKQMMEAARQRRFHARK